MKELAFYISDADKINRKYRGKHIAIVDDKVVAIGSDPKLVWEKAKKKYPDKQPVLAFVPKEDTLVLLIGRVCVQKKEIRFFGRYIETCCSIGSSS